MIGGRLSADDYMLGVVKVIEVYAFEVLRKDFLVMI
jgi:hypothetical protein